RKYMIRLIVVVPFLLARVIFSASNQDPQDMWMFTYSWKSSIGVLALSVAAVAFLAGAFCFWVAEFGQRRRARKAEQRVRELETQLEQVKATASTPVGSHSVPYSATPTVTHTEPAGSAVQPPSEDLA
ncbi:lipopolysaccharide assembly protein LapA domain-containing protein, partial [Acetobacter orientalis]|uniref:lipopolysaccharide assembly protein LapA domain-containing protein n=1 Tax=Acetobacter orientalis TaxID=146474 RepID=UPI0039E9CC97